MRPSGRIHTADATAVRVGTFADGFYVEDGGEGFGVDDPEQLFEPGYSDAEDGTGFGLAIVAEIAQTHDWAVAATTGSEGCARFEFSNVRTA